MTTRTATVLTHRRANETAEALQALIEVARNSGVTLRFDECETEKHGLAQQPGVEVNTPVSPDVSLCLVLGGDGTIFAALRHYTATGVPVFAVNFGEIGFLATVDQENVRESFERAFAGDFDTFELPTITVKFDGETRIAINDVSVHRKAGLRVADLAYSIGGEDVGRVRCDGLVVATPQGSTGYNLANGGPVLAWGVEGFVVSFVAPHSLTARPLVVAPSDRVVIRNASREEPVEVHIDGRPVRDLAKEGEIEVSFGPGRGTLAQLPGVTFYHRLRDRFGRLTR